MPQLQLPIFSTGLCFINKLIGYEKKNGKVFYFHGILPVFCHDEKDTNSFKFITSQLVESGNVKLIEIHKSFGVPYISVKRAAKILREEGPGGFYKKRKGRSGHKLTPAKLKQAQRLLYKGYNAAEISKKIDVKPSTIRKAIQVNRLHRKPKGNDNKEELNKSATSTTKSERSVIDSQTNRGIACTREEERTLAALGKIHEVGPVFQPSVDVKSAGVLIALPALIANGLLQFTDDIFSLPSGFYGLESIFVILSFAALLRIQTIDAIRYSDPGEMGKLVGLDRIPEVKTLRKKLKALTEGDGPEKWSRQLSIKWLEDSDDLAGTLYVDGHVRVYHGKQTKLPRRYVAREKLFLRGITDYWVNDAIGQPFFVVPKTVDPGMLKVLRTDIIPRLLEDIPNQPAEADLEAEEFIYRFGIVFDREGYSPAFFKEMWIEHRIVCYTYRKNVKSDWAIEGFENTEVIFPNGEKSELKLAERVFYHEPVKTRFREIRNLTETGHQTSVITTDFHNASAVVAPKMFARWSQENFFKYMMEHFGINKLFDYQLENIDETTLVVNPEWRKLDKEIKSINGKLSKKKAECGNIVYENENDDKKKDYAQKKSKLSEEITAMNEKIKDLEIKRKREDKHIEISGTVPVVNPEWRKLDSEIRSQRSKLSRKKAKYGDIIYDDEIKDKGIKDYVQKKSKLLQEIKDMEKDLEKRKIERKKAGKHIAFSKLPKEDQFKQFEQNGKQFIDTIKMIAYRAETALVSILSEFCSKRKDDLRSIVREMFMTDADIEPDEKNGILKISIHNMSTPRNNSYLSQLCEVLNESETTFPGTNLRLSFNLVSSDFPVVPEV